MSRSKKIMTPELARRQTDARDHQVLEWARLLAERDGWPYAYRFSAYECTIALGQKHVKRGYAIEFLRKFRERAIGK